MSFSSTIYRFLEIMLHVKLCAIFAKVFTLFVLGEVDLQGNVIKGVWFSLMKKYFYINFNMNLLL